MIETGNDKLYYVGVQFNSNSYKYSYICADLSVKPGDQVIVPVFGGKELRATVVTAQFYSLSEVPYPIEKTKRVVRKVEHEVVETAEGKPDFVLAAENVQMKQQEKEHEKTTAHDKKIRHSKTGETIINIIAILLATPIYALIIGFFFVMVFSMLGWKTADGGVWMPFLLAVPFAFGVSVYHAFNHPATRGTKRGTYYKNSRSSNEGTDGWYPGCPEEGMFSSMDNMFDYDGDGHLDEFESSSKYDSFFGDDE